MTLGRPRKYHTAEEQREAHRLRNKKHYDRNRTKIADKRRVLRAEKQIAVNESESAPVGRRMGGRRGTPLALARALFKRCQGKMRIIKGSRKIVDILMEVCVEVRDRSGGEPGTIAAIVEAHQDVLSKSGVASDLSRCHHEILNLVGCGQELNEVGKLVREVDNLQRGLDAIYAEGCLNYAGFLADFENRRLDFLH
ncbi:hypothetical protein MD484_g7187, partial [Candolleomyces efflorescens]